MLEEKTEVLTSQFNEMKINGAPSNYGPGSFVMPQQLQQREEDFPSVAYVDPHASLFQELHRNTLGFFYWWSSTTGFELDHGAIEDLTPRAQNG